MDRIERVKASWDELEFKIRAQRWMVFVRTDPQSDKIGNLYLPPSQVGFFKDLPHMRIINATVLSAGPHGLAAQLNPGDGVCFQRLHFANYIRFADNTYLGWIDANQLIGFVDGEAQLGYQPVTRPERIMPR